MAGIKDFVTRDWSKSEKILALGCIFFLGIIWGFLLAPIKKGIYCGNNNGNTCVPTEEEWEFVED